MSEPREHRPRPWIGVVALVAMVAVIAGAAWWAWPEGSEPAPPNGAEALDLSRAYVDDARTAHFQLQSVWERPRLDDPEGDLVTERYDGVVTVVFDDRSTSRLDAGPYLRDRVFDGATAYGREGDTEALLDAEPWRVTDLRTDALSSRRTFFDRPDFLPTLLADATAPRLLGDAGGLTDVQLSLSGSAALQFLPGRPFTQASAVLTVAHDGRPEHLTIRAEGPGSLAADLRFADWNEPAQVDVPTDIDQDPAIDAEEIGGYTEHALYQPTDGPPDWEILEAGAFRPDETGLACRSIRIRYGTPLDATSGTGTTGATTTTTTRPSTTTTGPTTTTVPAWPTGPTELVVNQHVEACPDPLPADAELLQAGRYTASVAVRDGRLVGGLTIDGVALRFDTDLDRTSLARVLASLTATAGSTPPTTSSTPPSTSSTAGTAPTTTRPTPSSSGTTTTTR